MGGDWTFWNDGGGIYVEGLGWNQYGQGFDGGRDQVVPSSWLRFIFVSCSL